MTGLSVIQQQTKYFIEPEVRAINGQDVTRWEVSAAAGVIVASRWCSTRPSRTDRRGQTAGAASSGARRKWSMNYLIGAPSSLYCLSMPLGAFEYVVVAAIGGRRSAFQRSRSKDRVQTFALLRG